MENRLHLMLKDMEKADSLYRPTNFWSSGLQTIIDDINNHGIENFRSHVSAHSFYVPLYSTRSYRRNKARLDKITPVFRRILGTRLWDAIIGNVSRKYKADRDYLIFRASSSTKAPDLSRISESDIGNPIEQFTFDGRKYSQSFLNYLRALNFLKNNAKFTRLNTVLEIGGGFGTLGEIITRSGEDTFYLNVDIPPVAAVSTYYLTELFGQDQVLIYEQSRDMDVIDIEEIRKKYCCAVICPWQLPKVKGKFDLFANFMSFQEMEPNIVENYISLVDALEVDHILIRNSKHGKKLAKSEGEVGVKDKIYTDQIIKMFGNYDLLNRDSRIFGNHSRDFSFESEVICMSRKL